MRKKSKKITLLEEEEEKFEEKQVCWEKSYFLRFAI